MKLRLVCSVIALILCSSSAYAEKMTLAVLDLKAKNVSKFVGAAVSDLVRSEMIRTGLYTVVERTQMKEVLREQGFQQTGCTDASCAVQVGKLVSATKILIGEINRIGKRYTITIRIVDVEKGVSEFSASDSTMSEDEFAKTCERLTGKISKSIVEGNKKYFSFKNPTGYYMRSIVPGWGQIYSNEYKKGYVFMGIFAVSAGLSIYGYLDYRSASADYDDLPRGSEQSVFDEKFDAKRKAGIRSILFSGITGLVYLAHWADILFWTKPDYNTLALIKDKSYGYTDFKVTCADIFTSDKRRTERTLQFTATYFF